MIRWRCGEAPIGRKEGFEVANGRTRAEHADEWDAAGLGSQGKSRCFLEQGIMGKHSKVGEAGAE